MRPVHVSNTGKAILGRGFVRESKPHGVPFRLWSAPRWVRIFYHAHTAGYKVIREDYASERWTEVEGLEDHWD